MTMALRTKVLVWIKANGGSPTDVGDFEFAVPPSAGDSLSLPSHPLLRVDWRTIRINPDQSQIATLGCQYLDAAELHSASSIDGGGTSEGPNVATLAEVQKTITEVQGRAFKEATAYVNFIIVAGYAAIFAIWQNTKSIMSPFENSVAAGLILFSFTFFVIFELTKMILTSSLLSKTASAAIRDVRESNYLDAVIEAERAGHRKLGIFLRVWPVFLALTIIPAALAAGFLFWKFYGVVSATVAGAA